MGTALQGPGMPGPGIGVIAREWVAPAGLRAGRARPLHIL